MAKRIADKELTDRNWDQEDEGEEAGTFSVASHDVMKSRAIKKAKRRNVGAESESGGSFMGFKGFSLASTASAGGAATPFSGFGNGSGFKGLAGLSNGTSGAPAFGGFSSPSVTTSATPSSLCIGITFNGPASSKPIADVTAKQTNGSAPNAPQTSGSSSKEYSRQLTALNCSVRDWITKHVNDNPLCDLNPIFRDYEQHLASIERKYGAAAAGGDATAGGAGSDGTGVESQAPGEKKPLLPAAAATTTSSTASSATASPLASLLPDATPAPAAPPAALFSFGKDKESAAAAPPPPEKPVPVGVTFNFGQKLDSSVLGALGASGAPPSFSFAAKPPAGSPFTAPAVPFSFSGAKAEAVQPTEENGDEESDEPPKPEVREIKEKDAFYSKKCKLFYKKDAGFKEKGVGTLHLKQTPEGKTQMILRADTNLGNILLNVIMQASMPCSRVGKNNVMVVCVPNPPVDEKNPSSPVPLLIRVKSSEDADQLHTILEEKKV